MLKKYYCKPIREDIRILCRKTKVPVRLILTVEYPKGFSDERDLYPLVREPFYFEFDSRMYQSISYLIWCYFALPYYYQKNKLVGDAVFTLWQFGYFQPPERRGLSILKNDNLFRAYIDTEWNGKKGDILGGAEIFKKITYFIIQEQKHRFNLEFIPLKSVMV